MALEKSKHRLRLITGVIWALVLCVFGCQTGEPRYISRREPAPVPANTQVSAPPPEVADEEKPKDLFVRQKDLKIRRKTPVNETGSVTDLNDPRAYLFGFERPIEIGSFVDVKIASNRAEQGAAGGGQDASGAAADKSGDKSAVKGADEAALLKALPNLDPADKNKPVLVKNIKMQILERLENGDVLVMYRRRSVREGRAAEVTVTGRLPAEVLSRPDQVSTMDLADIDWRESVAGEVAERKSANWEDEYSLRLSGFDETKSKDAVGLEEKREVLKQARDKLENEMKSFAAERSTMTKERAKLLDSKAKDNAKISDLEKQNTELQKKVDDLSPKDAAPGDKQAGDASSDAAKADANSSAAKPAATATKPTAAAANLAPAAKPPATSTKPAAAPSKDAAKKG
jgi:hypothetical protein